MTTPAFQPDPCTDCGSGSGGGGNDAESNLLCDTLPDGTVVGTALAVYSFDQNGNPTGPPVLVIPGTDDPYVPQGVMMACPGETGCLNPVQFCFTTTATGPVDHPGRQYDLTLPINPGFAVESLNVDAINSPANIVWNVDDPDGERFRTELTTFIEARVPASATVTITNPNAGTAQVCGTALPMQIHIECVRLDQNPPNLIELLYNGGQDLIQNPAYNESPALNPPVSQGNYGFRLLSRQDDPGPFPGNPPANDALCTTVANRGWETNDIGRTFEIWGQDIVLGSNVTPTPRGTPVQEITSDGPPPGGTSTIWQTFQAPATGNFVIRVVHGARDAGEVHRITLDNGDTDDAQNGDLIDDTTNPAVVTNSPGGPGPWTTFTQTLPLTAGNTYTLSLSSTNPVAGARGGLFTDMRAYIDRPDLRATATTDDDTCVVSVDETTTTTTCEYWSPICVDGDITSWKNAADGQVLTNTAFWGQTPAPSCCLPESTAGEGGGSVAANLIHSYLICGVVGGVQQTLVRYVITDASGGVLATQIVGPNGAPVAPASWRPGACADQSFMHDEILCDDNGPFLRKFVQQINATNQPTVVSIGNFTLAGAAYTPVGAVGNCGGGQTLGPVCWNTLPPGPASQEGFLTLNSSGDPVLYDLTGEVVADPYIIVICADTGVTTQVLCDAGNAGHPFLRAYRSSPIDGQSTALFDTELDGSTEYNPVGPVGVCSSTAAAGRDDELQILCDANGTRFLRRYVYDTSNGNLVTIVNTTLDGNTAFAPVGAVGICSTPVTTDFDFLATVLCDGNGTQFIQRLTFNSATGAVTATTNTTLTGAAFAPVGAVSLCTSCCPIEIGEGCYNAGSGRYTALRLANGTISLIDSVTGAAVAAANIIPCTAADALVSTGIRRITDATPQTMVADHPGLQSVTITVLAGVVNVSTNDGTAQSVPAGVSLTWSVSDTDDSSLQNWSCQGLTTPDYLLNYTYKSSVAG